MTIASSVRIVSLAVLCAAALGVSHPARARVHGFRAQRGDRQVVHVGGTSGNGRGALVHARGTRVSGPNGTAAHGALVSVSPDGSVQHRGGTRISGAHGGSYDGRNSYTRHADGSISSSHSATGTGAGGGTISSAGSFSRSAGGSVSGSSQTSASSARGTYDAATRSADGTTTHSTAITGAGGESYNGQTSYTRGQGVVHTGGCTDAGGNVIACGH
ncbi:MAG: hypothetical protein KGJ32_01060 [Xanthomonadaceae bacterium]|nr:hypothetical protein [Xanthomonadaceae bacterium]